MKQKSYSKWVIFILIVIVMIVFQIIKSIFDFTYNVFANDMKIADQICVEATKGDMFTFPSNKNELAIQGKTEPGLMVKAWGAGITETNPLSTKSDSKGNFILTVPKERIEFQEGKAELQFEDDEGKDTLSVLQDGKGCENKGKRHPWEKARDACGYLLGPTEKITVKCKLKKEEEKRLKEEAERKRKAEEERKRKEEEERLRKQQEEWEKQWGSNSDNDNKNHYYDDYDGSSGGSWGGSRRRHGRGLW